MKKLFLHIGPHKTGSTYIQKTLYELKDQLASLGVSYDGFSNEFEVAHHDLADKIYRKHYDEAENIIQNIKVNSENIFISSENFDRLDKEGVEFLAKIFEEYETEILFVRRRLDDLLISNWQESIKHGNTESWSKYCFRHIEAPFSSEVLNISKILDLYSETFGKNTIKIIDFDSAKESQIDICDIVFDIIGVSDLKGLGSKKRINQSMPYSIIEIIRVLNKIYWSKYQKNPTSHLRDKFLSYKEKNQSDTNILELQTIIDNGSESIMFNNKFVFDFLNKAFDKKYNDIFVNREDKVYKEKNYCLPNENILLDSEVIHKIELLFQALENY